MTFRADLHVHSTFSDGSFSPEELIDRAVDASLEGLSITDHDTVDAYSSSLFSYAKKQGISLMTGVEFSCHFQEESVHLLGYGMDVKNKELKAFCQGHLTRRHKRNLQILEKLKQYGCPIDETFLLGERIVGRLHIAKEMMDKGYVKSLREAFQQFLGDHKKCFVSSSCPSIEETTHVIQKGGGKAFLAHPHLIKSKKRLKALLNLPLDGIECYYALFPKDRAESWVEKAEKRGFLVSGGSDFHGEWQKVTLGSSFIDEERWKKIMEKK